MVLTMKLKNYISWLTVGLVAWLFWRALSSNWEQVRGLNIGLSYHAAAAVLLFAAAVIVSGILWGYVFHKVAHVKVNVLEAVRAHCAAWVLKYIPGQVGAYVYKLDWGKKRGASKTATTLAFAYDMVFLTLASTVVVIPIVLLGIGGDSHGSSLFLAYVIILTALFFATRKSLTRSVLLFIQKISGKKVADTKVLDLKEVAQLSAWYLLPRVVNAFGFIMIAAAVVDVGLSAYVSLGAIYVLAGIVGIYAFFVPSGLGVREGVIVLFASAYMSVEQAIVLSLLARLYATIADGIVAITYVIITKRTHEKVSLRVK